MQLCSKRSHVGHDSTDDPATIAQMFRISLQMSQLSNMKYTMLLYEQIHPKPSLSQPSQSIHFPLQL